MKKISNEELHTIFIKMKSNNEIEFNKLYENYKNIVYGIAFSILKNKEDSEEIVQTVFMKIFKMDTEMLPNKYEASWLYTITKNEAISLLRKKQNCINIENIYEIQDTENQINKSIENIEFNKIIGKLNNTEKEIVSLKIISNLSFYEIAKLLNKPVSTIKWKYYKSMNTLKIIIGNLGMFVITFVIGLKMLLKKEKTSQKEETKENVTNNEMQNQESTSNNREETKKEETNKSPEKEQETSEDQNAKQETIQETIKEPEIIKKENEYLSIGILVISVIFLIISITFFIKYQLKGESKASK